MSLRAELVIFLRIIDEFVMGGGGGGGYDIIQGP